SDKNDPGGFFESGLYTITPPPPTPQNTLADGNSFRVEGTFDTSGVTGLSAAQAASLSFELAVVGTRALDKLLLSCNVAADPSSSQAGVSIRIDGVYHGSGTQEDVEDKIRSALQSVCSHPGVQEGVTLTKFIATPNGPADQEPYAESVPAGHEFTV